MAVLSMTTSWQRGFWSFVSRAIWTACSPAMCEAFLHSFVCLRLRIPLCSTWTSKDFELLSGFSQFSAASLSRSGLHRVLADQSTRFERLWPFINQCSSMWTSWWERPNSRKSLTFSENSGIMRLEAFHRCGTARRATSSPFHASISMKGG